MCKVITTWYVCCVSQRPEPRREYCTKFWYRTCHVVLQEIEETSTLCANCKFKRECQEGGIDASAVLEQEKIALLNEVQQDEGFMPYEMQAWETSANISELLMYNGEMPQFIQEHQAFIPIIEMLEYKAHTAETVELQQDDWPKYIDYDGGDRGQNQHRLAPIQTRRQRQTKETLGSTTELGHKRKRRSRSDERETEKKHHRRRKAQIPTGEMSGGQEHNLEEWIILSQPIQKQGRNVYRTYACQELIAMQQSPQKLGMIARELAQEYDLDSVLVQENLGINGTQQQQLYREWRDKSCQGLTSVSSGACTPMINNEQIPIDSNITQSIPVKEEAPSNKGIRQSDAEENQAFNALQNRVIEQTDNLSAFDESGQMQPGFFHIDREDYDSLDFKTIMNATDAANQWLEAEQYRLPITGSMRDHDALP
ncbi:hypothetical protein MMC27_008846 [Xylographa pallens]|nr:hypothetical protein [Xylographa pallens]